MKHFLSFCWLRYGLFDPQRGNSLCPPPGWGQVTGSMIQTPRLTGVKLEWQKDNFSQKWVYDWNALGSNLWTSLWNLIQGNKWDLLCPHSTETVTINLENTLDPKCSTVPGKSKMCLSVILNIYLLPGCCWEWELCGFIEVKNMTMVPTLITKWYTRSPELQDF